MLTRPFPNLLEALRGAVRGRVTGPGDPGWDVARRSWNLSVDQRPRAVVHADGADDVAAVVRLARRAGLRVAPQATGHGAEALSALDDAILLHTSAMRGVAVDSGVVRAEAGAVAGQVADAAAEHHLAPALGLAATVGVTGLALGGGTGWLSRAHGLTANTVSSFEVVTADGERRRADARSEPELFWALRGGGGRFAVVTAIELAAYPVAAVSAGMIAWPAERAAEVLQQFRRWTLDAPESVGAVLRYLALPPVDAIPAPLRGRRIVAVVAAHVGTERDGQRLLGPLRASSDVLLDTFGPVGPADLPRVAGDPEQPSPARGDGFMIGELTVDATEAIAELIAGDALAPLGVLELRLLGGALGRTAEGHGALDKLDGGFSVFAGGAVLEPGATAAIDERLEHVRARLAPWTTPQALLSVARLGTDPARAFGPATWERLQRARDTYDPERVLLGAHG